MKKRKKSSKSSKNKKQKIMSTENLTIDYVKHVVFEIANDNGIVALYNRMNNILRKDANDTFDKLFIKESLDKFATQFSHSWLFDLAHTAYTMDKFDLFKMIYSYGLPIEFRHRSGLTMLMMLVISIDHDYTYIKYLLDNNANVNATTSKGKTAFMFACRFNRYKHAKFLLNNGAGCNFCNVKGDSSLRYVAKSLRGCTKLTKKESKLLLLLRKNNAVKNNNIDEATVKYIVSKMNDNTACILLEYFGLDCTKLSLKNMIDRCIYSFSIYIINHTRDISMLKHEDLKSLFSTRNDSMITNTHRNLFFTLFQWGYKPMLIEQHIYTSCDFTSDKVFFMQYWSKIFIAVGGYVYKDKEIEYSMELVEDEIKQVSVRYVHTLKQWCLLHIYNKKNKITIPKEYPRTLLSANSVDDEFCDVLGQFSRTNKTKKRKN